MSSILKWVLITAVVLLLGLFVCDDVSVRLRMKANKQGDPFDVLAFPRVLEIPHKGTKVEYAVDAVSPITSQDCVHSLFPHFGYTPCWYVKRKNQSPVPMVILLMTRER